MRTLFLIFLFVALIVMAIPAVFMYKIIRKSLRKPDAAGLLNEKEQMKAWLYAKRNLLQPWNNKSISLINNNLQYFKKKWTTRQAEGIMNTFDNMPLIAFKFIERGMTEDGHLYAVSSSFDLYVRYVPEVKEFCINGKLLGKQNRSGLIADPQGNVIGKASRYDGKGYDIIIGNKKLAHITKAKNLDNLHRNPFYKPHKPKTGRNVPHYNTEIVTRYNTVQLADNALTEEEKQWVIALGLFESIYHSIHII